MVHKWKVGDRARLKYVRYVATKDWQPGLEVIIIEISPQSYKIDFTDFYDCKVAYSCGEGHVLFDQLEPIIDTDYFTEKEELFPVGNWDEIESTVGWRPEKEHELLGS